MGIYQKGTTTYAFYLADAAEKLPASLKPEGLNLPANAKIHFAGNKKALKVKEGAIEVPAKTIAEIGSQPAYLFVIN
jgi:alpha-L-fucosidase